jgi:hypothetical protein
MNWKGFRRKRSWPNRGTILVFSWRNWEKTQVIIKNYRCPRGDSNPSTSRIYFQGLTAMPARSILIETMETKHTRNMRSPRLWTFELSCRLVRVSGYQRIRLHWAKHFLRNPQTLSYSKISHICGIWKLITVFTRVLHWSLSWADYSSPYHTILSKIH